MNFNPKPEIKNTLEVKKEKYLDLINDFGLFITLNASKLEQQAIPGSEAAVDEIRAVLRKPIINGMNYSDFTFKFSQRLSEPEISTVLIKQIYEFLKYLEPRLSALKDDAHWVTRFKQIKEKYTQLINS